MASFKENKFLKKILLIFCLDSLDFELTRHIFGNKNFI